MKAMQNSNSPIGWLFGICGGFTKMYILQIGNEAPYMIRLLEAGITALVCGFLGAVGTYLFKKAFKKTK